MTLIDTLQLIAARSPRAATIAAHAIRGVAQLREQRASLAAAEALADRDAEWTPGERAAIAALLAPATERDDDRRDGTLQFRVSDRERAAIAERADAAGMSMSDYLRRRAMED